MSHGEMPDNDTYKRDSSEGDEKVNWKKLKAERKESKKRIKESKVIHQLQKQQQQQADEAAEEARGSALQTKGRQYTVTVALPGSVMDNAQSTELRTYLAGQIARACCVFNVDEIVVFDEYGEDVRSVEGEFSGVKKKGQACIQLARILQFLECPQYLRKSFFPKHKDLQYAGLLNPLDSPHHMRIDEESEYREGVVLDRPSRPGKGSFVNCGMWKEVQIDKQLQPGLRVTVHLNENQKNESRKYKGVVVAPHVPRSQGGLYWGYSVRLASALSTVFTEGPYKEGYDLTIGTSEKGCNIDQASIKPFKHLLVVFGGLQGLEASVDSDQNLEVTDPSLLFDLYLNTCPSQGSRTIRTEEAILISMAGLRQKINSAFTNGS